MDYELAKKLKDMGFPSKYKNWECKECGKPYEDSEVGTSCVSCGWNGARKVDVVFRAPTLSELIEACVTNKEERCFYRLFYDWFEKQWEADAGTSDEHFAGYGKTPEEAVAKLWIELNK